MPLLGGLAGTLSLFFFFGSTKTDVPVQAVFCSVKRWTALVEMMEEGMGVEIGRKRASQSQRMGNWLRPCAAWATSIICIYVFLL
jgi:hypothetical protein